MAPALERNARERLERKRRRTMELELVKRERKSGRKVEGEAEQRQRALSTWRDAGDTPPRQSLLGVRVCGRRSTSEEQE